MHQSFKISLNNYEFTILNTVLVQVLNWNTLHSIVSNVYFISGKITSALILYHRASSSTVSLESLMHNRFWNICDSLGVTNNINLTRTIKSFRYVVVADYRFRGVLTA